MLDEFSVVVPTFGHRLKGVLRPAAGPQAGVLLLLDSGTHNSSLVRIFTELEMYLQAAGIVALRLSLPFDMSRRRRVRSVLGGVRLLRTTGARRIVIISSALDPHATWDGALSGSLTGVVSFGRYGRDVLDILHILRDLTTTIRDVGDYTVGVATLLLQPWRPFTVARRSQRQAQRGQIIRGRFTHEDDAAPEAEVASLVALLLPMTTFHHAAAAEHVAQRLIALLYSWSLALAQGDVTNQTALAERGAPALDAPLPAMPVAFSAADTRAIALGHVHATWADQLQWTDEQWHDLVETYAQRAPDRAATVHAMEAAMPSAPGVSLRVARAAWPLLDNFARRDWLEVCAASFSRRRLNSAV